MSFIRLLVRADRWLDWPLLVPIYDGRMCPECGALCVAKGSRKLHQQWHMRRTEFDSQLLEAVRALALHGGVNVVEPRAEDAPDGIYDPDDLDDRLTAKARAVAGLDDYDDEDEDDER